MHRGMPAAVAREFLCFFVIMAVRIPRAMSREQATKLLFKLMLESCLQLAIATSNSNFLRAPRLQLAYIGMEFQSHSFKSCA